MTSSTAGPGVQRFREMLARGDLVDAAALARQYPDEALALADEIRRVLNYDTSITREETWLARIEALREAGEDVSLGTSIRDARSGRGLTVAALAGAVRERGVDLTAAELRRIEANAISDEIEHDVWRALIEELNFGPHTIVAEIRVALSDRGMADEDVDSYLERLRVELGLPTIPPEWPSPERERLVEEGSVASSAGDTMDPVAATLVENWYRGEAARGRSPIGVPNAGLHILERFRDGWPLRARDYLTRGGGQVAGLSGPSGDVIVRRFAPDFMSMGAEAGRTSRSTPEAARRLAEKLNALPRAIGIDAAARANLADQMQRWIIEVTLASELDPRGPAIAVRSGESIESALERHLDVMAANSAWARSAARLLTTALDVALPGKATTDKAIPQPGLRLGDTAIMVSELPTLADVEACTAAMEAELRCLILTPSGRTLASAQLMEASGLHDVDVESAARFVARIIDVTSGFEPAGRTKFIEALNERPG